MPTLLRLVVLGCVLLVAQADAQTSRRRLLSVSWFFPGLPVAGVQAPVAMLPVGLTGCVVTGAHLLMGTVAANNSLWNIQRCTANCDSSAAATFSSLWSSDDTVNNDKFDDKATGTFQNCAGGSTTVCYLAATDTFKATIPTVGAATADYTVVMSVECDN